MLCSPLMLSCRYSSTDLNVWVPYEENGEEFWYPMTPKEWMQYIEELLKYAPRYPRPPSNAPTHSWQNRAGLMLPRHLWLLGSDSQPCFCRQCSSSGVSSVLRWGPQGRGCGRL